jgi:hypothetical protein
MTDPSAQNWVLIDQSKKVAELMREQHIDIRLRERRRRRADRRAGRNGRGGRGQA